MRGKGLLLLLPLSMIIMVIFALSAGSAGLQLGLKLVSTYNYSVASIPRLYCAVRVSGKLLVAGSIGTPPMPYAALLSRGELVPLTLPVPSGVIKGEVTGCLWSDKGLILYGYVTNTNRTPYAILWLYNPKEGITYRLLDKVIVKPIDAISTPTATYIAGYIGECPQPGALAIAYSLLKPVSALLEGGNYTGYVYAPGGIMKGRVLEVIANKTFNCAYFTALAALSNSTVMMIGYGRLVQDVEMGFIILHNSVLNGKPINSILIPMLPLSAVHLDNRVVAVGEFLSKPVKPGVLVVSTASGNFRIARLDVPGSNAGVLNSVSCAGNVCLAGGYMLTPNGTSEPIIALITLNGVRVEQARIYTLPFHGGSIQAVLLEPDNTAIVVLVNPGHHESRIRLLYLQLVETPNAKLGVGETSVKAGRATQPPILLVAGAVGASIAVLALVLFYVKRIRRER